MAESWPLARFLVLQNSESQNLTTQKFMLRVKNLSARDPAPLTKSKKKEIIESSSDSLRAQTGSVPHKMAEEQRVWAPCANRTQVSWLSATQLKHSAIGSSLSAEKTLHDLSYTLKCFATYNHFFCTQDCGSWISQVEYQGQAHNTRILERKPLIDTFYLIQHRFELKYLHFAQFLLIAHQAAHWPQKSENTELEI